MTALLLFSLLALFYSLHAVHPKSAGRARGTLEVNNLHKGNYSVQLFNFAGRLVDEFQIEVHQENEMQRFQLPPSVKPGTYNLTITDGNFRLSRTCKVA